MRNTPTLQSWVVTLLDQSIQLGFAFARDQDYMTWNHVAG